MESLDKEKLLSSAKEAATSAGNFLKDCSIGVVKSWGKDVKIEADRGAHNVIVDILEKTGIPILSEEDENHDFILDIKWVVDPLDGSMNFSRGIPNCAVSVCLVKNEEPILGVVYDFNREEMFSGVVGVGAWLNDENIFVSNVSEKGEAIIMTGFPSYTDYSTEALEKYISKVQSFKKVRLIGSAALSLAYVASGRADIYFEKNIKIWDVAAGLALVKSAGGEYLKTGTSQDGGCEILAGNKYLTTMKI